MSVKIELSRPIEISGAKVGYLTMREPLVRDMRAAKKQKKDDMDAEILLIANLCEVTQEDIDSLPMCDYQKVQEAFSGFFSSKGMT